MDILQEINGQDLRRKAIDELIEVQNKIINDCLDRYNFYKIELEKINILESLAGNIIEDGEKRKKYTSEIDGALKEVKQAISLKIKLENLK
ncbi:hypothetical protein [Clostridium aciditolerans]|uniref:Uncharacterized protein n=1 Tax=Clostridium aciditolerans TaxID=339861 RepID=A0A934HY57_9CLOT|nr:hypothetical protein [Clostridium aciditolerans]MBI6875478.1 hypothetical protein [Clostridium aciditolerans]